jgi:hypothetical protein
MKNQAEKREQLRPILSDINQQKSALINIMRKIEGIDRKRAEQLGSIIGRLEQWQNK